MGRWRRTARRRRQHLRATCAHRRLADRHARSGAFDSEAGQDSGAGPGRLSVHRDPHGSDRRPLDPGGGDSADESQGRPPRARVRQVTRAHDTCRRRRRGDGIELQRGFLRRHRAARRPYGADPRGLRRRHEPRDVPPGHGEVAARGLGDHAAGALHAVRRGLDGSDRRGSRVRQGAADGAVEDGAVLEAGLHDSAARRRITRSR